MSHFLRLLLAIVIPGTLPSLGWAEPWTNNAVSVTAVSQTITFPRPFFGVDIRNKSASAGNTYHRLFVCGETPAAATTANVELAPSSHVFYAFDLRETTDRSGWGPGYCAMSIIAATTATVAVEGK